ncbi:hypothetical protein N7532_009684 [Penicillium argentinense]|uniref:N-acetyltransferase domain-containing protein n=1 Tax=Penicillium argentinense TaxID=1131581 RepID=A0A9W9EZZ1_9EURO|nr:uncharacterized protein N7532_009684 [Penicillium argentinense]KAJ5091000.1 hypothetical protein N7532_009684 [Penicillium argentinense]
MGVSIEPASFPEDTGTIHSLFSGYAASLGIDLTFQSFQDELESIPGKYAEAQGGALLIARTTEPRRSDAQGSVWLPPSSAIGCVALRRSSDHWCEIKRLYVVPEARGLNLGDRLVEAIVAQAKSLGYRGMRLDTLPEMLAAQRLYRKYGFIETEPYYETPLHDTIFMACDLTPP